jgi:hypothetical protein
MAAETKRCDASVPRMKCRTRMQTSFPHAVAECGKSIARGDAAALRSK